MHGLLERTTTHAAQHCAPKTSWVGIGFPRAPQSVDHVSNPAVSAADVRNLPRSPAVSAPPHPTNPVEDSTSCGEAELWQIV